MRLTTVILILLFLFTAYVGSVATKETLDKNKDTFVNLSQKSDFYINSSDSVSSGTNMIYNGVMDGALSVVSGLSVLGLDFGYKHKDINYKLLFFAFVVALLAFPLSVVSFLLYLLAKTLFNYFKKRKRLKNE